MRVALSEQRVAPVPDGAKGLPAPPIHSQVRRNANSGFSSSRAGAKAPIGFPGATRAGFISWCWFRLDRGGGTTAAASSPFPARWGSRPGLACTRDAVLGALLPILA